MAQDKRHLLVVDDSDIDRLVLKSMIGDEYYLQEVTNGSMAIEFITRSYEQLDAILLDITMPHITGFDVLHFMRDKGITDLPVFLITSESTRENVELARKYGVEEFICKPFIKEDILRRLHSRLGVVPDFDLQKEAVFETNSYIEAMRSLYQRYLINFGKNDDRYRVMEDLMGILLTQYSRTKQGKGMVPECIEIISKAAYFCDIGEIFIPDKRMQLIADGQVVSHELRQSHTVLGANFVRLNHSEECKYFVEICSGMCMHHHERWDGNGYPDGIRGKNNSIFNLLCRFVDDFEDKRSKFYGNGSSSVKFILRHALNDDQDMLGEEVLSLIEDCELQIQNYFTKM